MLNALWEIVYGSSGGRSHSLSESIRSGWGLESKWESSASELEEGGRGAVLREVHQDLEKKAVVKVVAHWMSKEGGCVCVWQEVHQNLRLDHICRVAQVLE